MSGTQVDYDQIAPVYDHRFTAGRMTGIAAALQALAGALRPRRILEVGCGTGHWLAGLLPTTGQLCGLDLSAGMLQQAQKRDVPLDLVCGRASQLPYPDATFDLVCCVNALHHFQHQRVFIGEARRLLKPGGALAVAGMSPPGHRDCWYLYRYFEGTYEADLARFPSWGKALDWMAGASFERIEWNVVEWIRKLHHGRAVWADPFLDKNSTSQLALLSDEAYAAGLDRIETALATAEATGQTLPFPVDLQIAMLVGWVHG
jgi:ubiquinone/menaquinone biosynthesis C-methylase UbiE